MTRWRLLAWPSLSAMISWISAVTRPWHLVAVAFDGRGLKYLFTGWWIPVFPAIAVFLLAFIANMAGDAVRSLQRQ